MYQRDSWTIVYDTIYACQDREDDKRVGIKSTALLFGEHVRLILAIMVAILLACLMYAGYALGQGIGYAAFSCGGTLLHTAWQIATWNEADLKDHRAKFEVCCSALRTPGFWADSALVVERTAWLCHLARYVLRLPASTLSYWYYGVIATTISLY